MEPDLQNDMLEIQCNVCFGVCLTMTDCKHTLCRVCYIKITTHSKPNMRNCPYCRKEHPTLISSKRILTAAQRKVHYQELIDFYNERNAFPIEPRNLPLDQIIFEYGLNRVINQSGREINYSCPLYNKHHVLMGTLGEIREKSYNKQVINKFGILLGTVDDAVLYHSTDATYFA